jgi:oligoendopeptidase F
MNKIETHHWDLSDLHNTCSVNETMPLLESIKAKALEFSETYKGNVAVLNPDALSKALRLYEDIRGEVSAISQYAHLNFAVNIKDSEILKFVSKIDEFSSEISNILLFFFLEIGSVAPPLAEQWCEKNDAYKYAISQSVLKHKHRLTEKEEQWINLKDLTGVEAMQKIYAEHTSRYEFNLAVDGQEQTMNGTQCRALRYHENPEIRRQAMALFFNQYKADEHLMVTLFNSIIKDYNIERIERGYPTPISRMNSCNDLPDHLVDRLHDITTESNDMVARYYNLKKKVLGLDEMTLADIYAPMQESQNEISWNSAKQIVLRSFRAFDEEFYTFAKGMFDTQRVDVYPSKVKRGGAFCSSSRPGIWPYVMVNYLGKDRDVATLAHELGHAIHAIYSSKQSLINYHAILPVCETASVFCEMLVLDELKKQVKTPAEKRVLLASKLEDIFATSHRQNMFSRFEKIIHNKMTQGRLSGQEISSIYADELRIMFGDSVKISEEYHWEWASIPHMLDVPFYVYSYNFGNLLVLGLYQTYLKEGRSFIPKLKHILSAGSSCSPVDLMASVGIDILSGEFWMQSLGYISSILDEFADTIPD